MFLSTLYRYLTAAHAQKLEREEQQVAPRKTAIVKAGYSDPEEDAIDKKAVYL